MTPQGIVKITDFGLARLSDRTRLTTASGVLGTPAYMSPEQARGDDVDRRTDIWSLGVVLYEMLGGQTPFRGDSVAAVAHSILHAEPEPLTALRTGLPVDVDRIMGRVLAKNPADRYQHADDFAVDMTRLAREPRSAGPAVARSSRFAWIVAGVLLIAALVEGMLLLRRGRPVPEVVRFRIPSSIGGVLGSEIPSLSPDGRAIVLWAKNAEGNPMLWLHRLDSTEAVPLAGTEDAGYHFWSPDGRAVTFFAGSHLKRVNVNGGPAEILGEAVFGVGGSWGPRGELLISPENRGVLELLNADRARSHITELNKTNNENSHRWPRFLPDERRYLYLARSSKQEQNAVYLGKLGEKGAKRLIAVQSNVEFALPSGEPAGWLLFIRDGNLMAQRFDAGPAELSGEARVVAQKVHWVPPSSFAAFSVSADGRVLAFRSAGFPTSQLQWFSRSGARMQTVGPRGQFSNPRLSPDFTRVALDQPDSRTGNRDIWTMNLATGILSRLTLDPGNDTFAVWSPDGARIVYGSDRATRGFELYRKPSGGVGEEEPLHASGLPNSWSLDGKWMVHTQAGHIALLSLQGERKTAPLVASEFTEAQGALSPDSRWLAFTSNESGRYEVYVRSMPEIASVKPGKWLVSVNGGSDPRWRSDGKELFYVDPGNLIMAVGVDAKDTLQAGVPKALFRSCGYSFSQGLPKHGGYDVAPDGQRFLINCLAEETASAPVTVVINWAEELKR